MLNPNLFISDMISDKMNIYDSMLYATMEDGIDSEICGTEIVTVDGRNSW